MTSLSEKALEILQADTENTEFSNSNMISCILLMRQPNNL